MDGADWISASQNSSCPCACYKAVSPFDVEKLRRHTERRSRSFPSATTTLPSKDIRGVPRYTLEEARSTPIGRSRHGSRDSLSVTLYAIVLPSNLACTQSTSGRSRSRSRIQGRRPRRYTTMTLDGRRVHPSVPHPRPAKGFHRIPPIRLRSQRETSARRSRECAKLLDARLRRIGLSKYEPAAVRYSQPCPCLWRPHVRHRNP